MRTLFYNGKIYTGDLPLRQAMLIADGCVVWTGDDAQAGAPAADRRIDLQERFVCPGFNDSHMHLLGFGQTLSAAQLAEHTDSLRGMLDCLRAFLRAHPPRPGQWLRGRGWNQDYFGDTDRMPDRRDLDAISRDVPILITRACGHCCVVNSRALALAGIGADTADPEGGAIGREENGEPDGRLYDNAIDLATGVMPLPDKDAIKDMLRRACGELNRCGVTSAQTDDYCVFRGVDYETVNAAYRELEAAGELTVRVCEQCNFTDMDTLRRFLAAGNRTGKGSGLFRIGPLKLLGDGSLGSRTAHLSRPYLGADGQYGFNLFSDAQMREMIAFAHANGMQIAVHAIGDACLDQVLDAYDAALQKYPRHDHRHGIVHCQISRADQLRRIRALELQVYAQSVFLDYDNHIVEKLVAPELARTSYCWKTLLREGVRVSNGSDCPVELPDVMKGVQCAVTRRSLDGTGPFLPEEAFTVREALDSFTRAGAEASFEENVKGTLAPGMLADFTVLDADPFDTAPDRLGGIPVRETWLGGERVYQKPV